MGNCIDVMPYSSAERSRVLIHNGGEKEFRSSTPVKKITSGRYGGYILVKRELPYASLPPDTVLEPGEVYYLMPPLDQPYRLEVSSKLTGQETCAGRKVKIVVTRQQLELLLRNSKQLKLRGIAVQFSESFKEGKRKWQPSLVTIPEVGSLQLYPIRAVFKMPCFPSVIRRAKGVVITIAKTTVAVISGQRKLKNEA
ncbi:hypothetical protein SADUNF_Sadunf06G0012900 [Salix dunnii]|uniref:Uncharacterized protein n=1 Tax=Salix dunnii TaxID=1413687 RepID=A0A835MZQ1_9ROSI|nr:hypothetical protein SADUNF_Sadunf06G0012900 [Salix dunnii]